MGLDEETVEPVYFNLEKNKHCLIMGQTQRGKQTSSRSCSSTCLTMTRKNRRV